MSDIRVIKSEEQYKAALDRIDVLFDAEDGTKDGDELELLLTLVEVYENEKFPMDMPDPIAAIKFRMEQQGLTQRDLIPFIGSSSKVSEVLSGKRNLTIKMIRALNKHLKIPAEVLIKDQSKSLPAEISNVDWDKFPIYSLIKYKWVEGVDNWKDCSEEIMRGLIDRAGGPSTISEVLCRKNDSSRLNAKMDSYALQAWCFYVLAKAREKFPKSVNPGYVTCELMREVTKLSTFREGPRLAQEYLESQGIALIIAKHLPKTYLDGAAMRTVEGVPVVGMTIRYDRLDNFWFCLMHELAHIKKHIEGCDCFFIDDLSIALSSSSDDDKKEREADELAQEVLIPKSKWNWSNRISREGEIPDEEEVKSFARELKISPAIVAGRVRFELNEAGNKNAYRKFSKIVGSGEVRRNFPEI